MVPPSEVLAVSAFVLFLVVALPVAAFGVFVWRYVGLRARVRAFNRSGVLPVPPRGWPGPRGSKPWALEYRK